MHPYIMCTHTSTFSKFFLFQVVDIREVEHLKGLKLLRALNLSNNPIQVSMLSSIWMIQLPCGKLASITKLFNFEIEYLAAFSSCCSL